MKKLLRSISVIALFYFVPNIAWQALAQELPMSRRMADSFMARHKDSILVGKNTATKWDYEQGLMLKAIEKVWNRTGEGKYFEYIRKDIDQYVKSDGSIRTYKFDDFNIDNIPPGRALLTLYQQTQPDKEKYKKAVKPTARMIKEITRLMTTTFQYFLLTAFKGTSSYFGKLPMSSVSFVKSNMYSVYTL